MKMIAALLAFILSSMTIEASYAGTKMFTTLEVMDGITLNQEREKIITFMESKDVQSKMIAMGVNPQEAIQRVAGLSSSEVSKLSREIDKAPAGGDGVGSIVGAALLVFIILLITDILGYTKVFPFTRSVR